MTETEAIAYIELMQARRQDQPPRHLERLLIHEVDFDDPAKQEIEEQFMFTYGPIAADKALAYYQRESGRGMTLEQAIYAANVALMVAAVRYRRRFSTIRFGLYVKATIDVVFEHLSAGLSAEDAKNR